MHKDQHYQLIVILLIVFIGFIGTSIAYPIFAPLFLHPAHGTIIPAGWNEKSRSVFLGIALAAYPLGQFLGSPILGSCSDQYGRKRILVFSLIGGALGYLLSAIALQFDLLWTLIFSRFFTGIMEGNFAIVRAMAADLKQINKYKSLGRINSVSAIGFVMGPLLGGFLSDNKLISWFSFSLPFFLAAIFATVTVILAATKLHESHVEIHTEMISVWQRFNLITRFKILFKNSQLKYLFIVSSIFTLSVDIFYEFGPVYLTGRWLMTPAEIAIYNAILSLTLAIGSGWLAQHVAKIISKERAIIIYMAITGIILGLLVLGLSKIFVFLLFALIGLSIAAANTSITIQLSDIADRAIQGEVMGTQLSLRMLGDAVICLLGGILIISSVATPLLISSMIAFLALGIYAQHNRRN